MLNFLTSLARTGIPIGWGVVVAWLTARGVPDEVLATVNDPAWSGALVVGAVGVITTAVYALVRVIELSLPRVLSRFLPADVVERVNTFVVVLLLGVPRAPEYQPGESPTR